MKILALSDVHGDQTFMRQMAEKGKKENVDLVILAGDIVNHDGSMENMVGPFIKNGLEVAVMPGNHDSMAEMGFLIDQYGAKNLHGYVLTKGDVGIFGCGYANIGPHVLSDEDTFNTLHKTHEQIKHLKKKIMVTHVHPKDSVSELGMFEGSDAVKMAIERFQPDIHICGHIHETHGIEETFGKTKSINVGKTGKIIEL